MRIERWHALLRWLMPIVVATLIFGTIYALAIQLNRLDANDDPTRLASQVATEMREGLTTTLDAQPHVDLSRSLADFVVVENAQGVATAGSGYLTGNLVSMPSSVLENAAKNGHDDTTWQPRHDLGFATVTVRVDSQFVTAGQSLAPADARVGNIQLLTGVGWLASLLVIGGCWFWLGRVTAGLRRAFAEQSQALHSSE